MNPILYLTTTDSWSEVEEGMMGGWRGGVSPGGVDVAAPILSVMRSSLDQQLRCNAQGIRAPNMFITTSPALLKFMYEMCYKVMDIFIFTQVKVLNR